MQRLRLRFGRGEPVRFISHLDTLRCWERVFRRASVPLAYTRGFTPHPRISVAAPLAVGVISDCEVMDIWLRKWVPPQAVLMMVRSQLPAGFTLSEIWQVPEGAPSLQASLRMAGYVCIAGHPGGVAAAQSAVEAFSTAESVVHSFTRGDENREVNLRPLVHRIAVEATSDDLCQVVMEVSIGQGGSARPDHVLAALGCVLPAESIERVSLSFGWPEENKPETGARVG